MKNGEKFLTSFGAAKALDLSTERVRQLERQGKLKAIRAGGGRFRLFFRKDVEQLARERQARIELRDSGKAKNALVV